MRSGIAKLLHRNYAEVVEVEFNVERTVAGRIGHLDGQLVTVTALELAPGGFIDERRERNTALHPLPYLGLPGEVTYGTVVSVVVSFITLEINTEDGAFAIFLGYEAFELQGQVGSRCRGRQDGCIDTPYSTVLQLSPPPVPCRDFASYLVAFAVGEIGSCRSVGCDGRSLSAPREGADVIVVEHHILQGVEALNLSSTAIVVMANVQVP